MAGYDPQRFKIPPDRENSNEWDMHIFNITSLSSECTKSSKASLRDELAHLLNLWLEMVNRP